MFKKSKYVYAIYKEGSFTKAAESLEMSQPCLSAAIKSIESKIGAPLFERGVSPVVPTEIGIEYIKTAEKILELEESFVTRINDINSLECGTIRVGGSNYISSYILPKLIDMFYKRFPNVTVLMSEADSSKLMEMLQNDELDLIVDSFDSEPSMCLYSPLFKEKILLAVPQNFLGNADVRKYAITPQALYASQYDCSQLTPVSIENFIEEKFILLKSGNSMYEHAMNIFRTSSIAPKVGMFLDQLSTSYFLASQGNGCCFLTDTIFRYHKFDEPMLLYNIAGSGTRTFGIAHKKGKHVTPAIDKFIEVTQKSITRSE